MSSTDTDVLLQRLGSTLYDPSAKATVPTVDALRDKSYVMLYFSAHWCPPCRRFTPLLQAFYKNLMAQRSDTELVFCSLDHSQAEYDEYTADMPWKCLPYSDASSRQQLAMQYGAQGIPHLVVVNRNDGSVITEDGTESLQTNPTGFPWKPPTFAELWPAQYLAADGTTLVDSATLASKHLMLYFSAHWCPPCKGFTPVLSTAYTKLKAAHPDDVEVVFVSSDRDQATFQQYHQSMTFCALPFAERAAKEQLSKCFGIRGIPSLLMLGPLDTVTGERPLINAEMRAIIASADDAGEWIQDFPFYPKPYQDLATGAADGINEHRSLIVFCENEDDADQSDIVKAVKTVAEARKDSGTKFFYATQPGGVATAVRRAVKLENKMDTTLVLLDIPDNGGYYLSYPKDDITPDLLIQFLDNPGERLQLSPS